MKNNKNIKINYINNKKIKIENNSPSRNKEEKISTFKSEKNKKVKNVEITYDKYGNRIINKTNERIIKKLMKILIMNKI